MLIVWSGMFGTTYTVTSGEGMFGAQQNSTFRAKSESFEQPSTSFGGIDI